MITISHTITLLAPMSHGDPGPDLGNVTRFRRLPMVDATGQVIHVPALSAGALRGVVRRLLWREVFDRCGLGRDQMEAPKWDRLYAALANGGHIERAESRISPDDIRARRAAMPVLSLLGAALYGSHMAGRAQVSTSWLDCWETGKGDKPAADYLADEHRVRHVDREEQEPEVSGVTPMPTTIETVITGATLSGHARVGAALEASAWCRGLDLVRYLGGKSGQGFGEVTVEHDGSAALYLAWLDEHTDELRASLLALADELGATTKKPKK
jgi:hypothetical protein